MFDVRTGFYAQGIYVINAGDGLPCKIGVTNELEKRVASLQSGNWNELRAHWFAFVLNKRHKAKHNIYTAINRAAFQLEQQVIKKMKELDLVVRGEWVMCDPDAAVAVIQKVAAMYQFELSDAKFLQSATIYHSPPKSHLEAVAYFIDSAQSAQRALGVDEATTV